MKLFEPFIEVIKVDEESEYLAQYQGKLKKPLFGLSEGAQVIMAFDLELCIYSVWWLNGTLVGSSTFKVVLT